MILYFIRHAQSTNNALWDETGLDDSRSADPGLTEIGNQQVSILADFLATSREDQPREFGFTHLYTSLMIRAVLTSYPVAQKLSMPLHAWVELHEGGGIYLKDPQTDERNGLAGNPRSYFEASFPNLILPHSLDENGWWNRPYEDRTAHSIRAQTVLYQLQKEHGRTDHVVVFFSHGGFFNYFINALLHKTIRDGHWFSLANTAIARFDLSEQEHKIVYTNRTDFLPAHLVT